MRLSAELKPLILRTLLFVGLFTLVSGIIGPWVIKTKLLFDFNFYIYGNLGKLVIFSVIIFIILAREKLHTLKIHKFSKENIVYLGVAMVLTPLFFITSNQLLLEQSFTSNLPLSLLTHAILIAIPLFILFGVFGKKFLGNFVKTFRKELLICLGLSLILFVLIFQVWKLWPYLSHIVLQAQYLIFSNLYDKVYIIEPRGLYVNTFAVEIAEACSGLESIFLFTFLYIFISVLDWKKLNIKRVVILFPFLIAGLILVNIIRVFLLILVGVLINPQLMATLFHTYLGLILFVIYFLIFLRFGYNWLKR